MHIEMELSELCRTSQMNAVVLREAVEPHRQFPIFIGPFEAEALEMALHGKEAPRPLTHDLVLNVIRGMHGTLRRVIVDKLEENVFYCKLEIGLPNETTAWVDCRPSDAMVLASKTGVAIYTDDSVLEECSAQSNGGAEEETGEEGEEE